MGEFWLLDLGACPGGDSFWEEKKDLWLQDSRVVQVVSFS